MAKMVSKPKATMLVDHTPHETELIKLGCLDRLVLEGFMHEIQNKLMKIVAKRVIDNQIPYAKDEIICDVYDEYRAELDRAGHIVAQRARVRVFFLCFITGDVHCELGINDRWRRGKEIVGRHDIIPVKTEEWITIHDQEFHCCIETEKFEENHMLHFTPLDGKTFEICRFRVRPRLNFELPLLVSAKMYIDGRNIEIRIDAMCSGFYSASRRARQAPCENIQLAFPVPLDWVYLFKYERFGYRSVKSVTRKPGKIKGFDRITQLAHGLTGGASSSEHNIHIEVNTGQAKYENITQSLTWRIPELPDRSHQGAYKPHLCTVKMTVDEHIKIPETFEQNMEVEYHVPATIVSKAAIRSISVQGPDEPPDKWVKYHANFRYKVEIEYIQGSAEKLAARDDYGYADVSQRDDNLTAPTATQEEYPPDSSDSSDDDEERLNVKIKEAPAEEVNLMF